MSLDELARAATTQVRTSAAARDVAALRGDLDRRLARHRRRTAVLAAAVVLAIVLSGLTVVLARRHATAAPPVAPRPTPTPARLTGNGPIVITDGKRFFAVDAGTGRTATTLELPRPADGVWGMSWSPDGRRLLLTDPSSTDLWDVDAATYVATAVCPASCGFPAWSADGRSVAVLTGRNTLDVVALPSRTTRTLATIPSGRHSSPIWSPDGATIGYVDEQHSRLVLLHASDGSPVAEVPLDAHQRFFLPAWSPDGSQIALLAERGGSATGASDRQLVVDLVPVQGTTYGPARLLRSVGHCFCIGFTPGIGWSPDGRLLALVTIGTPRPGGDGLNLMRPDGTGLRLVQAGAWGQPAWQPVSR